MMTKAEIELLLLALVYGLLLVIHAIQLEKLEKRIEKPEYSPESQAERMARIASYGRGVMNAYLDGNAEIIPPYIRNNYLYKVGDTVEFCGKKYRVISTSPTQAWVEEARKE